MKFFINDGVCKRKWKDNVRIEELPNSRLRLLIPNYSETEKTQEDIRFTFSNITSKSLENDLLIDNVSLVRAGKNTYYITPLEETNQTHMYALLRSTAGDWDDVFIPSSLKDKVNVLRRIQFFDGDKENYKKFLSNAYLIKIKLDIGERIPIYFSYGERGVLKAYYAFYRPRWDEKYHVTEKVETLIFLTKDNTREYKSLSTLCN